MGRLAVWLVAFVGLAHVGSGTASRLLGITPLRAAPAAESQPPNVLASILDTTAALHAGAAHTSAMAEGDAGQPDGGPAPGRRPRAITKDGRVVLNLAGERELVTLPGIGVKRAQAILALRARLRRFRRVDDLLRVRGIGFRSLKRLRPLVVVDPPERDHE